MNRRLLAECSLTLRVWLRLSSSVQTSHAECYRLVRRGSRNTFNCVDTTTGRRTSLGTSDAADAHHYAEYETQANGQKFFSLAAASIEPTPISHSEIKNLEDLRQQAAGASAVV